MESQKIDQDPMNTLEDSEANPEILPETFEVLEIQSVIQKIARTKEMVDTIHEKGMHTTVEEMYPVLANTLDEAQQKLLEIKGQFDG